MCGCLCVFLCVWVWGTQAYRMRPSIIFFDEIDGLAPVRSSRQDQIHRSVSASPHVSPQRCQSLRFSVTGQRRRRRCRLFVNVCKVIPDTKETCARLNKWKSSQLHRVDAPRSDGRARQSRGGRRDRSHKPARLHRPCAAAARAL